MARFRVVHQNMFRRNTADGGAFFCCFISSIVGRRGFRRFKEGFPRPFSLEVSVWLFGSLIYRVGPYDRYIWSYDSLRMAK